MCGKGMLIYIGARGGLRLGLLLERPRRELCPPSEKVRVQVWSSWCHSATPWENLLGNEARIEMKDRDKSLNPEFWVSHQQ